MKSPLPVYIEFLPGKPAIPLLYPNTGKEETRQLFMGEALKGMTEPLVSLTEHPDDAAVILVPHNFSSIQNESSYFQQINRLSEQHGKRVIAFAHGDSSRKVPLKNARIFRTSLYRSSAAENEIAMPAYAEDLLGTKVFEPKKKHEGKPVVGFCGWAEFTGIKNRLGTYAKQALLHAEAILQSDSNILARQKGLLLRKKVLSILEHSPDISAAIIRRQSYSGHEQTVTIDPAILRSEYIQNLEESDFCLALRGDGNYSCRFYEALSLGRLVLFIDTDCVLPLEDILPYNDVLTRIDFRELEHAPNAAKQKYDSCTPEQFEEAQIKARKMFEDYLSPKAFFTYAVEHLFV